jgi:inorganic triphosphatase YgiF
MRCSTVLLFLAASWWTPAYSEDSIPPKSKVYIAPMGGFETYFKAALEKKKVPLQAVAERAEAEFEITGTAESQKASAAKILMMGNWHSREQASISVTNLKTGVVVFVYSVHKASSAHGKRSAAEACAKHLKAKVTGK